MGIHNVPSFLWFKINRESAEIKSARLFDRKAGHFFNRSLMWRKEGSNVELEPACTLVAGALRHLYLFAKQRHNPGFFVYTAERLDAAHDAPLHVYQDDIRRFTIELHDRLGRVYRFNVTARNAAQSVELDFDLTWEIRWVKLRRAFRLIGEAFSRR